MLDCENLRTVIAGGRDFNDREYFAKCMKSLPFSIGVILCGKARGADTLGEKWGIANNIPIEYYPALWEQHKNKAGFIRNELMVSRADCVVCFWDGVSSGTRHTIKITEKVNKPVYVFRY